MQTIPWHRHGRKRYILAFVHRRDIMRTHARQYVVTLLHVNFTALDLGLQLECIAIKMITNKNICVYKSFHSRYSLKTIKK